MFLTIPVKWVVSNVNVLSFYTRNEHIPYISKVF